MTRHARASSLFVLIFVVGCNGSLSGALHPSDSSADATTVDANRIDGGGSDAGEDIDSGGGGFDAGEDIDSGGGAFDAGEDIDSGGGFDAGMTDLGRDAGRDAGAIDMFMCTPSCGSRECGDDGCGGLCGTCSGVEACTPEGVCCSCAGGSPTPVARSFTALADSVDFRAPARGGEQWHGPSDVEIPAAGAGERALDVYMRSWFTWARFEPTRDNYDFSRLATEINAAIDNGQKFSFGMMTLYPGDEVNPSPSAGGSGMSYPMYLHTLMQNASDPMNHGSTDWDHPGQNWWVPNYNSEYYLDRLDALNHALNEWLNTQTHSGVTYRDAIGYIDIRAFGTWGEWHHATIIDAAASPDGSSGSWPVGMRPTVSALKRIVDAYTENFTQIQLVAMISSFDAHWFGNTWNPPEIAQYILDASNEVGPLGWRRDQWGSDAGYVHDYLENNNRSFGGGPAFKTIITERWKYAPVTGEPECSGVNMSLLPDQVTLYHAASVGNGNYCTSVTTTLANNVRAASRRMGYRIILTGGMAPGSAMSGQTIPVTLSWRNIGIAPTYEQWTATYELQNRTSNAVVWSAPSSHQLRLFLPATSATSVTDMLTLPSDLAPGDYRLVMKVIDPSGYRDPLPLAIEGRRADGSYTVVDTFSVGMCSGC